MERNILTSHFSWRLLYYNVQGEVTGVFVFLDQVGSRRRYSVFVVLFFVSHTHTEHDEPLKE